MTNKEAQGMYKSLNKMGLLEGVRFAIMVSKNTRLISDELKELNERSLGPDWFQDKRRELLEFDLETGKLVSDQAWLDFVKNPPEDYAERMTEWELEVKEINKVWEDEFPAVDSLRRISEDSLPEKLNPQQAFALDPIIDYNE